MYRFLLSPRWIGLALLMAVAAVVMGFLGQWQLDRFHTRSDINTRIDTATANPPLPFADVRTAPGQPLPENWIRVTVTGRYDPEHELLARARTVGEGVGFEIITPLVLADGTAVLIDRGWLPAAAGGAAVAPEIPPAPSGEVTVVGRVHAPESRATAPEPFANTLAVRRIAPAAIADVLPYPVFGAYLTLEEQTPPADPAFVAILPNHENATMNAGYVAQWWLFAIATLIGYIYLARREARTLREEAATTDASAVSPGGAGGDPPVGATL